MWGDLAMLAELQEDYENDTDELMEISSVKDLRYELINENIKSQVEDTYDISKVNFVDEYFNMFDEQMESNGENPERRSAIIAEAILFCTEVIELIDDKFDLGVNFDELEDKGFEDVKNLTYALYDFFVINYRKNIKKFFVKYILSHLDDIYDAFSDTKNRNDVYINSLKEKLSDERAVVILGNLKSVISYISSFEISGKELLKQFNPEKFDIYIIKEALNNLDIDDSFVTEFLYPVNGDYEDDQFTDIFLAIQSSLYKKFLKKTGR